MRLYSLLFAVFVCSGVVQADIVCRSSVGLEGPLNLVPCDSLTYFAFQANSVPSVTVSGNVIFAYSEIGLLNWLHVNSGLTQDHLERVSYNYTTTLNVPSSPPGDFFKISGFVSGPTLTGGLSASLEAGSFTAGPDVPGNGACEVDYPWGCTYDEYVLSAAGITQLTLSEYGTADSESFHEGETFIDMLFVRYKSDGEPDDYTPEPSSWVLTLSGGVLALYIRRHRSRSTS